MTKQYQVLSTVAPNAERIVQGIKTLEVRSWRPEKLPLKDLVIVENTHFLNNHGDEEMCKVVALIDIESVHPWLLKKLMQLVLLIGRMDISLGLFQMYVL